MNRDSAIRSAWIGAACALALALALAVRTAATLGKEADRLAEYAKLAARLDDLEHKSELRLASIRVHEQLQNPHPLPVSQLLANALPDAQCETRELQSAPTIPGWTVRRVEVSFPSVDTARLAGLLVAAENCRPPWRVVELAITALGESGSSAQVRLVAEALDKTQ